MAFDEVKLSTDISYGAVGGPEFNTSVQELGSGHEVRNQNWSVHRCRYNLSYGIRTLSDVQSIIEFFYARKGKARGFRFKDFSDYNSTGEILATAHGTSTGFQLKKIYASGAVTYDRNIFKTVAGTVKVYFDSTLQSTGLYTINNSSGTVHFASPPANGKVVSASFEFDVPVRFDTDHLPMTYDTVSLGSIPDIQLIEIKQ